MSAKIKKLKSLKKIYLTFYDMVSFAATIEIKSKNQKYISPYLMFIKIKLKILKISTVKQRHPFLKIFLYMFVN